MVLMGWSGWSPLKIPAARWPSARLLLIAELQDIDEPADECEAVLETTNPLTATS
jgi:hypothetical protein